MNPTRTRGEIESEITQCVLRILKDAWGKGPTDTRSHLCESIIVVRCRMPLQPPEKAILQDVTIDNISTVREWRRKLCEACLPQIHSDIGKIVDVKVRATYSDNSPVHEETIIIITLENKPELKISTDG